MKKNLCVFIFFLNYCLYSQEIFVNEISTESGDNFFSETKTSQPPMIVRGKFGGDSYFWTPIGIGDSIVHEAFKNNIPFTGTSLAYSVEGKLIGKYVFKNGFIEHLEEYKADGKPRLICNYLNGIPHGENQDFDWSGSLRYLITYNLGILHGPYFHSQERIDAGLPPCIEEGEANNGKLKFTRNTCDD